MRHHRTLLALVSCSLLGAGAFVACDPPATATAPNVVVIMTDDQTAESLRVMPKTLSLLGERGTTFDNAFVSYPLCCPSRATLLTGQYSHNHGVESNRPPSGGYGRLDHGNTLPHWLQDAGYHTTHIGKYLNGYGRTDLDPAVPDRREVPPGWSDWQGLVDPSTYRMYGYTVNDNGELTTYGNAPEDYQTDVLADRAEAAITARAGSKGERPFFLSVAPLAPHSEAGSGPPRAAPRHEGAFAGEPLPGVASFDEADVSDKPSFIRSLAPLGPAGRRSVRTAYRDRLEALLAVDDLVARVVHTLDRMGELDDTVIVFTSDNGFFHGEHRVRSGKFLVYDEAVRVPLLVRGGRFPEGAHARQLVANVDLAPTIVELTRARSRRTMDGRSLVDRALHPDVGAGRAILLETGGRGRPTYEAVRTRQHLWVEHSTGEVELYDLVRDPGQLVSRHDDPGLHAVEARLRQRLAGLRTCAGGTCSAGSG